MPRSSRTIFAYYLVIPRGYTWNMEHFTLVMVTTDHLVWVTTDPTATTWSIIKSSAGSYTLRTVRDLYAMGPRCSICTEIEIPFARGSLTVTRRSFRARVYKSQKALSYDGRLTAEYAIYRLP